MVQFQRGDALAAVVEAALDAGLDPATITQGLGYSSPEKLRRAVRASDPKLASALRIRRVRDPLPPPEQIVALLDDGVNTTEVCRLFDRHPSTIGVSLKRAGYLDEARRFFNLSTVLYRTAKKPEHGNNGATPKDCPAAILY